MVLDIVKSIIYNFYFFIYKMFYKKLIRLITKTHEIERIIIGLKIKKINKFVNLGPFIKCISNSSQLNSHTNLKYIFDFFLQNKPIYKLSNSDENYSKIYNDININKFNSTYLSKFRYIPKLFSQYKSLSDSSNKMLKDFFYKIELILILNLKLELFNLTNTSFDSNNIKHISILKKIWLITSFEINKINNKYNYSSEFIGSNSVKWLDIGFQGKLPETDLRSTGIFGLIQLRNFCEKSKDFNTVFKTATSNDKWYFFAVAGINITGKIRELILLNKDIKILEILFNIFNNDTQLSNFINLRYINGCDNKSYLYIDDKDRINYINNYIKEKVFDFLDSFYSNIFISFNEIWINQENSNFMKFNTLFEEFCNNKLNAILKDTYNKFISL